MALTERSEHALALRAVRGDRVAQSEIFHLVRPRVTGTLRRLLGPRAPIDDLVQETLFSIFRALAQFRGEASIATFADRIAVRAAYRHFSRRRPGHWEAELGSSIPSSDPRAEETMLLREATEHLHAALERLDAPLRIAFLLHAVDERPMTEVAAVMESSLEITKTRIERARRALESAALHDPTLAPFVKPRSGQFKIER
jgi:RNA polymerase sigma-70 factor (ECF subfamily)